MYKFNIMPSKCNKMFALDDTDTHLFQIFSLFRCMFSLATSQLLRKTKKDLPQENPSK